jgi:hypothetical protein
MKAERACIYIMYIKDTKEETTNQMASYLSLKESRKEKHTPKPAETSPPEEDFLSFFSLNESPYE